MRSSKLLLAVALAVGSSAASTGARLGIQTRDDPRVVRLDMYKNPSDPVNSHLLRKRKTVQASLDNMDTLYFVNASVGTPPQGLRLHLDTGSSDMWVNTNSSNLCSATRNPCAVAGTYSPDDSSTSKTIGSGFNISYVDGTGAAGDYVTDTFHLSSVSVPGFQFGVGTTSSTQRGILGLGYAANEVQVLREGQDPYENLPLKLASQGQIRSAAYSIYLNDFDAQTGTVLFGGVDRSHYRGDLSTLPIQSESDVYRRLLVTLTRLDFGDDTLDGDMALAVLLDSGSSITYLPDDLTASLHDLAGATFDKSQGLAFVPCSLRSDKRTLRFSFSGAVVSVDMDELVLDLASVTGRQTAFADGEPACLFGVAPAGSGTNVLGDTFMRSAYVVFDLANNEVSIAQTRANSPADESDVVEIGKGRDPVPGAKRVADPVRARKGLQGGGQSSEEKPDGEREAEGGENGAGRVRRGAGAGAMAAAAVMLMAVC